ncbi:MAG TPA: hypothetical protein VFP39_07780 [Gemmatimonadales bacterium]|nr:hypothetical protein [Gemmatimonadales bacterium]
MTQPDRFDALRRVLQSASRIGVPSAHCLDAGTIAAMVDGTLEADRREAALTHLAGCDHCQTAVASVARALVDPAVASELSATGGQGQRRLFRVLLPVAAAAALLLVVVKPWGGDEGPGGHRAPPPTAVAPEPLGPIGVVADAHRLWWSSIPGADRYRVTLSDASGGLLFEMQGVDTNVALPDSITLVPGHAYLWLVEARTGFDRWSTSRLAEFSIAPAAKP